MRLTYILFIAAAFIMNFVCWYYIIVFCGIYKNSCVPMMEGAVIGVMIDWFGISLAIPIIKSTLRVLIRKYPNASFLLTIEYFFWVVNYLC